MLQHHFAKAARRLSRLRVAAVLTTLAMAISATPAAAFDPNATLVLTTVASGLSSPVLVTHAGDGSGRIFIVEQTGKIKILKGGAVLPTPFLSLSASILAGGEQGLLGLAFHPQFKTNGKFYVYITLRNGNNAVNEYRVDAPFTADTARWQTGRRIMTISHPTYSNHNGGNLAFGPDGYLYIGTGDGGGSGDPFNRSQNLNSYLGKILRINPNNPNVAGTRNYRNPQTNPYVGRVGLDEIWARGVRNPWRFSFDRANGDMWIGDVGQNRWEEIDVSRAVSGRNAGRGANYGWRLMEGRACFRPATGCTLTGKVRPIAVYGHNSGGCSVTGGYVYRGPDPKLFGGYIYGDFCTGDIWGIDAAAPTTPKLLADTFESISSFGEDEAGNLYLVDLGDSLLGGTVYRLSMTP